MTTARALVVDDSKVIQFKLSKMLQSRGLGTHVAGSGTEALAFLKTHRPDFILMDYMMEDIDGYEVTRQIVEDPATAAIPVIICTGEDTAEARTRAAENGARGFMVKPVDDAALDRLLVTLQVSAPQASAAPARIVTPAIERAPNETPDALAQAAARDAVDRALDERLAAGLADIERTLTARVAAEVAVFERSMQALAEQAVAAAVERALDARRVEENNARERFAQEVIAAAECAVDVKLAPMLEALKDMRAAQEATSVRVKRDAIEAAHVAAREAMSERDVEGVCAITAEIEALKAHHATFEQRLDGLLVRASETSTTTAHHPEALEDIATAATERLAHDVVNDMRDRVAASQTADDQVAPPAIASRRGNSLLVPWMAGLTVVVLWILVRTLA